MYSPAASTVAKRSAVNTEKEVDYSLNKNRAAQKKVDAADRPSVNIVNKHDNVILEFSAGAYECFRNEFSKYFNGNVEGRCVLVHQKKEKKGLFTEHSYSITSGSDVGGNTRGSQLCRVSMYHTSCRVMVNGRRYKDFMTHDLAKIVNQMESNPDLKEINDKIKTACQLYLTEETKSLKRDGSKSKGKKGSRKGYSNQGSICDGRVTTMDNGGSVDLEQEDISGDGTDAPDCQSYDRVSTCMHCDEICESAGGSQGSIYCDSCESWMHWVCEGLSDMEGCALGNSEDDYTCWQCSSNGESSLNAEGDSQEVVPSSGGVGESSIPIVIMGEDMKGASPQRPSVPLMPTSNEGEDTEGAPIHIDLCLNTQFSAADDLGDRSIAACPVEHGVVEDNDVVRPKVPGCRLYRPASVPSKHTKLVIPNSNNTCYGGISIMIYWKWARFMTTQNQRRG